ncbi:unnamed protein product [Dibothriocephalus latus]|uniref:F-actin-capping protein subunit alpha n=1 Tax=Dibothriocephalus latus TaxID=60516 RepID=A0A3P7M0K2_DIBLA|nr:unnamed protein product [Dibothriocephalus latus]
MAVAMAVTMATAWFHNAGSIWQLWALVISLQKPGSLSKMGDGISPELKAQTAASLVLLAPPQEVEDVVKAVRTIVGDCKPFEKNLRKVLLQYAKEQTVQVALPGCPVKTLITEQGDLQNGRFLCPRTHNSFTFDPLTFAVDDVSPTAPNDKEGGSVELEPWRRAIEDMLTTYIAEKFPTGAVSVFAPSSEKPMIYIYIEGNIRKQFSSGRWRSSWVIEFPKNYKGSSLNVTGDVKVQTHIFEQGNVQLMSSKKNAFEVTATSPEAFAADVAAKIAEFDTEYQFDFLYGYDCWDMRVEDEGLLEDRLSS